MISNANKSTLRIECPCGGRLDTQYDTDYADERHHAELLADKFFAVHNATHMATFNGATPQDARGEVR